jgi:hypothetical protein
VKRIYCFCYDAVRKLVINFLKKVKETLHIYFPHQGTSLHSIYGASVAEWLRSLTSNHLPLIAVGSESRQGLWILSCEEAIQLAYGTSVVPFRCPFVPEIMHGMAPEVFLHQ